MVELTTVQKYTDFLRDFKNVTEKNGDYNISSVLKQHKVSGNLLTEAVRMGIIKRTAFGKYEFVIKNIDPKHGRDLANRVSERASKEIVNRNEKKRKTKYNKRNYDRTVFLNLIPNTFKTKQFTDKLESKGYSHKTASNYLMDMTNDGFFDRVGYGKYKKSDKYLRTRVSRKVEPLKEEVQSVVVKEKTQKPKTEKVVNTKIIEHYFLGMRVWKTVVR